MRHGLTRLGLLLLFGMGLALAVSEYRPVEAQPPTLVYGNNSGTPRPLAVNSIGALLVPTTDPCASASVAKSSVVLDVTVDAIVVALTAGQTISVCGWVATVNGTAPSYRFQSGTGSACATSADQLSGVFLPIVGSFSMGGNGGSTVFSASLGEDLCVDMGGTTPSVQGVISFVKQ